MKVTMGSRDLPVVAFQKEGDFELELAPYFIGGMRPPQKFDTFINVTKANRLSPGVFQKLNLVLKKLEEIQLAAMAGLSRWPDQ